MHKISLGRGFSVNPQTSSSDSTMLNTLGSTSQNQIDYQGISNGAPCLSLILDR